MNPLIFWIAGGDSFWVGLFLLLAITIGTSQKRAILMLKTVLLLAAIILIVVSMTPLPYWWFGVLSLTVLLWLFAFRSSLLKEERKSLATRAVLFCGISGVILELPYALLHSPEPPSERALIILADSLTAGLIEDDFTWPKRLAERVNYPIVDLSHVGAVVGDGLTMIEEVELNGQLVLIELGGNDLLGSTPGDEFHQNLNQLLKRLTEANCRILMFELPLPPFRYDIAYSQRRLCDRYNVQLIPKRYLLSTIIGEGKTVDSLHLSDKGHAELADFMEELLKPTMDL
jgi:acyl-CoA thioesterase-1